MGMIERAFNKKKTQAILAPEQRMTSLSAAEVVEVVMSDCDEWWERQKQLHAKDKERWEQGGRIKQWAAKNMAELPAREYFAEPVTDGVLVSKNFPADKILSLGTGQCSALLKKYWMCKVTVSEVPGQSGRRTVEIVLTNWLLDNDGKVRDSDQYLGWRTRLFKKIETAVEAK